MTQASLQKIISGSALIAGTSIGAGMLAIPLITSQAGFIPAMVVTALVWLFMLVTGLLLLEVTLWLPEGSNFLSLAGFFLGPVGRWVTGVIFAFLYYCLMVAYFAAGAPLLLSFFEKIFHFSPPLYAAYIVFGLFFGGVVAISPRSIDRVNLTLTVAMFICWGCLIGIGSGEVSTKQLSYTNWSLAIFALPVLFSAFGYHNIIPSLCSYLGRNTKVLRGSIIIGTTIPFLVYAIWQWLIMGVFEPEMLYKILKAGQPVTVALKNASHNEWIQHFGELFALFAIVTSTLGVAFSFVDFLGDGFGISRKGWNRIRLTLMTFIPPFCLVLIEPAIFDAALSIAGGFGEALLNGFLPITLLWIGRYYLHIKGDRPLPLGRVFLSLCLAFTFFTIIVEVFYLMRH